MRFAQRRQFIEYHGLASQGIRILSLTDRLISVQSEARRGACRSFKHAVADGLLDLFTVYEIKKHVCILS